MGNEKYIVYSLLSYLSSTVTIAVRSGSKKISVKKTVAGKSSKTNFPNNSINGCFHIYFVEAGKYLSADRSGTATGLDNNSNTNTAFCFESKNSSKNTYTIHSNVNHNNLLTVESGRHPRGLKIIKTGMSSALAQEFKMYQYYDQYYLQDISSDFYINARDGLVKLDSVYRTVLFRLEKIE